jgi:hypothetical protein
MGVERLTGVPCGPGADIALQDRRRYRPGTERDAVVEAGPGGQFDHVQHAGTVAGGAELTREEPVDLRLAMRTEGQLEGVLAHTSKWERRGFKRRVEVPIRARGDRT